MAKSDTIEVLYEDNHLIVVNKPWSLLVQGDKTGDDTLIDRVKAMIKVRDKKPGNVFLGLIHRLDRPTSGAVVLAKTTKALERMNRQFSARRVEKIYWAVLDGTPEAQEARLENDLKRNPKQNKSYAVSGPKNGSKKAALSYRILASSDRFTLAEVRLETGRHHQIRAQFAAIGLHIKGDLKYGARRSNPGGGIHLHARSVSFDHPVTQKRVTVTAPPPADPLWKFFSESQG